MPNVLHALFVAWQNPVTRSFFPVARLAQIQGEDCPDCFEFAYVQGALTAEGFLPFVSFPDQNQIYRSRELFPMFANRILSTTRSDFPEYIELLGLPSATTNPITILSRSAGRRATDTLELFPLPEFEPGYGYRTWFWAHDLRYLPPSNQDRILQLLPSDRVLPECDCNNAIDIFAINLVTQDRIRIGFMPSYLLDDAHTLQESCDICEIYVERVNPHPVPAQQRLLCCLNSCWPDGWVPYSTQRYQPLSSEASVVLPPVFDVAN